MMPFTFPIVRTIYRPVPACPASGGAFSPPVGSERQRGVVGTGQPVASRPGGMGRGHPSLPGGAVTAISRRALGSRAPVSRRLRSTPTDALAASGSGGRLGLTRAVSVSGVSGPPVIRIWSRGQPGRGHTPPS